jgi:hypothetical protein
MFTVFYQPAHEELLRWPTLSDYIGQHRTDLIVLDGLERKAELWSLGKRELLEGSDLAHARYLEHRGLASNRLKAFMEASRVSERPVFSTRATRPIAFFYGYTGSAAGACPGPCAAVPGQRHSSPDVRGLHRTRARRAARRR